MLFARLLERQRAAADTAAMLEGAAVSALAHGILIGGWLFLHRDVVRIAPETAAMFTPVEYLIPKDRIAEMRPQRETVTFATLAATSGEGFQQEEKKKAARDEPRMEMVVPKGKESDARGSAEGSRGATADPARRLDHDGAAGRQCGGAL